MKRKKVEQKSAERTDGSKQDQMKNREQAEETKVNNLDYPDIEKNCEYGEYMTINLHAIDPKRRRTILIYTTSSRR